MAEKTAEGKIYIYWIEYDRTEKGPIFNYYSYKATSDRQLRHYQKRAADETLTEYIANSFIKKNKWLPYSMQTREDLQQEAYLAYMEAKQNYDNRKGSREAFFFNAIYKHLYKKYQEANSIERRIDNGRYYLEYKQSYTEQFAEQEADLYHKPKYKQERAQEIEAEQQGLELVTYQRYQEYEEEEEAGQASIIEPEGLEEKGFNDRVICGVSIERLFGGKEYETIYFFDKVNLTYPRRRAARMKLKTAGFVKGVTIKDYPCAALWPEDIQPGRRKLQKAINTDIRDITIRPMNFKEDNGEKKPMFWEPYYKLVTTNRTAKKPIELDPNSKLPKVMPLEYVTVDPKRTFSIEGFNKTELPLCSKLKVKGRGERIEYHSLANTKTGKLYKISIREKMKRAQRKYADLHYGDRLIRDLSEFAPFITEKGFNSNYDDLCRKAWEVIDTFPDQQRRLFELYYKNNEVIINTKNKQKILFDSFGVSVYEDRKITDSKYVLSEIILLKYTLKDIAKILKIRYTNILNLHSRGIKELSRHYNNESSKKFPGTFKIKIL